MSGDMSDFLPAYYRAFGLDPPGSSATSEEPSTTPPEPERDLVVEETTAAPTPTPAVEEANAAFPDPVAGEIKEVTFLESS